MTATSSSSMALAASGWLSLAATPTFAVMALVSALGGGGAADAICSTAAVRPPFGGMVAMYALMSVFHAAPWLRLSMRRQAGRGHPASVRR